MLITPLRIALAAAFVSACASAPRESTAPSPALVAAPAPAADAGVVARVDDAAVAVDPCAAGPTHDALAALAPDHVLADRRVGGAPRPDEQAADLAPLFPAVRSGGFEVLAVTPTDALPGGALVALVAAVGAAIERDVQVHEPALALLTCRAGAGWTLAAAPYFMGNDALVRILSARPTALPGGAHGVTVTVFSRIATAETTTTPYLLGAATPALPIAEPRGAAVGVLAVLGNAGERVVAEGTAEYRTLVPFDAAGWYPLAQDQTFVRIARSRVPSAAGQWSDAVSATTLGRLGAQGFVGESGGDAGPVWLLVGPGEPPAWCVGRSDVRCARLTVDGAAITDGAMPYAWVAGAWPAGSAVPRDLRAPGARWLYAGSTEAPPPRRDPTGHPPLTSVPVRPGAGMR